MSPRAAHIELKVSALQHNLQRIREYAPEVNVMAVIKANAYGHGMLIIAQHLAKHVDAYAVARLDEAIALRVAGIDNRILVLQGFSESDELELLVRYQLEVVIYAETQVELLELAHLQKPIVTWVKVDTGMNRLGFPPEDLDLVMQRLQQCNSVHRQIKVMTHFANADDTQDKKTLQQLQLFDETTCNYSVEKSCANSAAIIVYPQAHQDWIRPGLMIYGVSPILERSAAQLTLLPVMSLHAKVIAIKQLKKGQAVGYGGSYIAEKDTLLGVVSIGYGDGYPRSARPGTPVLINQQRFALIGRVSMDMITVDITPHTNIRLGDQVLLWGGGLPVEEIASYADTIPYTLLCGVTHRVQVVIK